MYNKQFIAVYCSTIPLSHVNITNKHAFSVQKAKSTFKLKKSMSHH